MIEYRSGVRQTWFPLARDLKWPAPGLHREARYRPPPSGQNSCRLRFSWLGRQNLSCVRDPWSYQCFEVVPHPCNIPQVIFHLRAHFSSVEVIHYTCLSTKNLLTKKEPVPLPWLSDALPYSGFNCCYFCPFWRTRTAHESFGSRHCHSSSVISIENHQIKYF